MRHVRHGYDGLSALVALHGDRMMTTAAILGAMLAAAWVQSL